MKTVKDAVIENNGIWPKNQTSPMVYYGQHIFIPEFEEEAKRLGYINGYRWGVEYPTNSKRPELVDGISVVVQVNMQAGFTGEFPMFMREDWSNVVLFKITDQRYKPSDTSYLNVGSVVRGDPSIRDELNLSADKLMIAKPFFVQHCNSPSVEFNGLNLEAGVYSMKKEPDNSWFEKGEFPPAGAECEVKFEGAWRKTTIVGMFGHDCVFVSNDFSPCVYDSFKSKSNFRPIKSDCQKFIESAIDAAIIDNGIPAAVVPYLNEVFERMFHAGFKSPEEIK